MFIILSLFYNPSGEIYYGFFSGRDTLYNSDAFLSLQVDFYFRKNLSLYIKYSSLLEMAEQMGRVFLDPMFATYSIVFGMKYKKYLWFDFYINHYCRHYIDKALEEGKVVFNGEFYSIRNYENKFEKFSKNYAFNFTYAFYPDAIIVDWLNSRPFYRHRFILNVFYIYKFFYFENTFEYTISREEDYYTKKKFYKIVPQFGIFYKNNKGVFNTYIDYYLMIKDPLRNPKDLLFFCISFHF